MIEVISFINNFKDEELLKKAVREVIKGEGSLSVSIAVVGEKRMRAINRKYRKKDKATDVLSFSPVSGFPVGEIIICPAKIHKGDLSRTIIHGALHLFDYIHKTGKEEKIMKKKEDYYLKRISLCQDQK